MSQSITRVELNRWAHSKVLTSLLLSALLCGVLAVIYRPWSSTALEMRDFSEIVPVLAKHSESRAQALALSEYYRSQGRSNAGTNLLLVAAWRACGTKAACWGTVQVALLGILCSAVLVTVGCRGGNWVTAFLIGALLAFSAAGRDAALRPTGEVLAASAIAVIAAVLASDRTRLDSIEAMVLVASGTTILVTKEALVPIPFLLSFYVLLTYRGRAALYAAASLMLLAIVVTGRAALIVGNLPSTAYASAFASHGIRLDLAAQFSTALASPEQSSVTAPGLGVGAFVDLMWFTIVLAPICFASPKGRMRAVVMLVLLSLTAGGTVYALWGRLEPFYGLPFLAGLAVTVGIGLRTLRWRVGLGILTGLAIAVPILAVRSDKVAVSVAHRRIAELMAIRRVANLPPEDTIIVRTRHLPFQEWQSPAATMARFRRVLMLPGRPVLISHTCSDARDKRQGPHRLYLTYELDCGDVPNAFWRSDTSDGSDKRPPSLALSERLLQ
jgi:hypothetical protein